MFKRLQGNARGCLMFEPLFILPYSCYLPYAALYMRELGVTGQGIGYITTLCLGLQIFTSFASGFLTDSMGRKRALLIYDLVSWSAATLLWAIAQNVWFFIAAAVFNSFLKVPNTAWYCLLVEDTEPKERSYVFNVLQLITVVGGLFAPLGGLLVEHLTLVPAVRLMYAIAFVSMTAMFFGRHRFTRESEMGVRKRQESRNGSLLGSLKEYRQVTKELFANAPLMIIFCVYVLFQFQQTMKNTFLSLFLVEHLQVGAAAVSLFPAVTSAVMLLLMYKAVPRLKEAHAVRYMIGGFALSLLSNVILIFQSPGSLFWLILSTVLAASGSILTYAYLEAAVANSLDDEKRAASFSILTVLILICIAPSGMIGGWAYALHPAVPFALICVAFLLSIALMVRYKNRYLPADSSGDIV